MQWGATRNNPLRAMLALGLAVTMALGAVPATALAEALEPAEGVGAAQEVAPADDRGQADLGLDDLVSVDVVEEDGDGAEPGEVISEEDPSAQGGTAEGVGDAAEEAVEEGDGQDAVEEAGEVASAEDAPAADPADGTDPADADGVGLAAQAAKTSISKAKVASVSSRAYTGKAIKPSPKVTYGGRTLRRDTDYTLSYKNNTKVGTATITVRGKGKYTGTKTAAFKIYPSVRYYVHRQTYGWETTYGKRNGEQSGTTGQSKRLEGIRVKLSTSLSGSIQYRTHIQGIGWQGWRSDGKLSGTTGKSKRLEAIRIRLTGQMAQKYDVWYRVHAQRFGWMGWAKNGQSAGTEGYSYRLEAIQIVLKAKGSSAPAATYKGATRSTSAKFKKSYPIQTGTTYETADFKVTFPSSWKNRWSASKSSDGTYYTFDADSSGYSSIGVFGSEQTLTNTRAMRMIYCGRSSRGKYIYWYSPPMNSLFVRSGATITVK